MSERQAGKQTLTEALRALQARGVGEHVFADFKAMDPAVILETCRWFDEQGGRVGPGVLIEELRGGGRKPAGRAHRRSMADEQREYGERIVDWLREHFPGLDRPRFGPHPAAVAEVIRLHWRHGKWTLTAREHGPAIRQAVRDFEQKWGPTGIKQEERT